MRNHCGAPSFARTRLIKSCSPARNSRTIPSSSANRKSMLRVLYICSATSTKTHFDYSCRETSIASVVKRKYCSAIVKNLNCPPSCRKQFRIAIRRFITKLIEGLEQGRTAEAVFSQYQGQSIQDNFLLALLCRA